MNPNNSGTDPGTFLKNIKFGCIKILDIDDFANVGKGWGRTKPEDPFNKFLKNLNMRSISIKKHEMVIS